MQWKWLTVLSWNKWRFCFCCKLLCDVNDALSIDRFLTGQCLCELSWTWKVQLQLTGKYSVVWCWAKNKKELFVGFKLSLFSLATPPNVHFLLPIWERKYVEKPPLQSPGTSTQRTLGCECENTGCEPACETINAHKDVRFAFRFR